MIAATFRGSSMVEQSTVNRLVPGSSPGRGADKFGESDLSLSGWRRYLAYMQNFIVPIGFPLGVVNHDTALTFELNENVVRTVPKKIPGILKLSIAVEPLAIKFDKDIDHGGIVIPTKTRDYFVYAHEKVDRVFQLKVQLETESEGKWDKDFLFGIVTHTLGLVNVFGYVRISPIIQDHLGELYFYPRLANLMQPGQDWFRSSNLLAFSLDRKIFEQAQKVLPTPRPQDYFLLNEHLLKSAVPLDWNTVKEVTSTLDPKKVFTFGKVLTEIIRQHPGTDYIPMISVLTAFIEGLLKISGENRYKFSIKLSNLFEDKRIAPIVKRIYDSRSDFFHTAVYKSPESIFDFAGIEFLLTALRKILRYDANIPIETDSFDFLVK